MQLPGVSVPPVLTHAVPTVGSRLASPLHLGPAPPSWVNRAGETPRDPQATGKKLFRESPQNAKRVIPVANTPRGDPPGMGEFDKAYVK